LIRDLAGMAVRFPEDKRMPTEYEERTRLFPCPSVYSEGRTCSVGSCYFRTTVANSFMAVVGLSC
jgi:hypothetical protein